VLGILKHLGASKTTTTISLPGIGKSHLARDILAAGFSRVCLGDVDAGAVRYLAAPSTLRTGVRVLEVLTMV
jgi:hypothetical protein